jgi:hypothetical protein
MKKQLITITSICLLSIIAQSQTFNNVGPSYVGTPPALIGFNAQLQTAQDNILMIQGNNVFGSNTLRNSIRVGIGVFPGTATPLDRLHMNDITSTGVSTRYTNATTGLTATDGFNVGINAAGDAGLLQRENLPMRFGTNALERMRILANGNIGINNITGNNRLEITSGTGNPYFPGASSGLRFTNLLSTSAPIANPGSGVLTVDANGDVILVSAPTAGLGNICGATPSPLTSNWEIPLGGRNYIFSGSNLAGDRVGIGNTGCTPLAKLHVENVTGFGGTKIAGAFRNTGVDNNSVVYSAVVGISNITGTSLLGNVGGNFRAAGSPLNNTGVSGQVTAAGAIRNNGGVFVASNASNNYGVNATASGGALFNAAIYGSTPILSTSPTGIDWAGYFNGSIVTTSGSFLLSDRRLKKDIKTVTNSIEIIKKLNPVTYTFDQDNHKNITLGQTKQYGFISQEVKEILPELTSPIVVPANVDSTGKEISAREEYLGLNYQGFTAIMVDAIKTQQQTIEAQQKQIDELKNMVKSLAANTTDADSKRAPSQAVNLSDKNTIVLNQNVPNPFAEQTVINYTLNEGVQKAQILFYDNMGKLINSSELKTIAGNGLLTVFASDLSNGLYSYSLVVDGKVIDTKKMVKN